MTCAKFALPLAVMHVHRYANPAAMAGRSSARRGWLILPSALICRDRENIQRQRAVKGPLTNVRLIAGRAPTAWSLQLADAEKREARHERTVAIRDLKANADQDAGSRSRALTDAEDLALSFVPIP